MWASITVYYLYVNLSSFICNIPFRCIRLPKQITFELPRIPVFRSSSGMSASKKKQVPGTCSPLTMNAQIFSLSHAIVFPFASFYCIIEDFNIYSDKKTPGTQNTHTCVYMLCLLFHLTCLFCS